MKKIMIAILFAGIHVVANAQQSVIRISGTRLAYPLFQQWTEEYKKTHAAVSFLISSTAADSSDMVIAAYTVLLEEIQIDRQLVTVARYVQLPIVNSQRKDLQSLQQKGYTPAEFESIYFNHSAATSPNASKYTLYTREKPVCATKAFAGHYGRSTGEIKGVGVRGDDRDLLEAVKKDTDAISYNNLGFIYDLKTRKVDSKIAIIPVDLNGNGKVDEAENFYNTLDDVIRYAEKSNGSQLAIADVHVLLKKQSNIAAKDFLAWVLQKGQAFNHQTGFLTLTETKAQDQLAIIRSLASTDNSLDLLYGKQN